MMSTSCQQQQQQQQQGRADDRIPPPAPTTTATAASDKCTSASAPVQSPEPTPPAPESKAILPLIGTTQSGKTTFIKFLHEYCDQDYDHARDLVVGDGVNSCTKVCKRYSLAVPDRAVTLVPKAGSRPASSLVAAAGGFGSQMAQQQQLQQQQQYQQQQQQQQQQHSRTDFQQFQQGSNSSSFAGGSAGSNAGVASGGQSTRGVSAVTASQETMQRQQQQRFAAANSSMSTEAAARDQHGVQYSRGTGIAGQTMVPQQSLGLGASTSASAISSAQAAALAAREAAAKSVAMAAEAAKMCQTIGSVISESEVSDSDDDDVDNMDAAKFRAEQVAFLRQQQQHQKSSLSAPSLAQRDSMSSIASTTATTSTAFTCESSSGSSGSDSNGMVAVGASMVASASGTGGGGAAGPSSTIMTPEITSLNTSASHSPIMLHGQAMGGLLSQQAQQQQQQLLSQQQYQHMSASHSSSDGGVPEFARPSPPMPATETPSSIVVEPMISATMQSQQASSLSSLSLATSQQQQNQAFSVSSSTNTESQQHDPETLRVVENAIRIATGLSATGGAQLTTPPPHIAQYIDSMTARHQCQEQFYEECAHHHQQQQPQPQQVGEVQAQGSAGGFSFSFKASTSSSSSAAPSASNSAGATGETRDRGLFGAESSGVSMETSEQQSKDRGLFGFRKWVGKKVHGGATTTTTISSDAAQFEHEAGAMIEPTDSMLSTTSTTTSMMTVTDTNVGNASCSASGGAASDQVQVTSQQPPEYPGPMSSGEVITMSRRSSTSSSSSDDSDHGLGRRHRVKTKIGGMLGLSSSTASSSVQYQQHQQEADGQHEQSCTASGADLYSQQCQDQLHDSSTEWSSTVHYAVTPSGQVVLDASGPSATMHQGSFAYPTGAQAATMAGAAAVGGMVGAGAGAAVATGAAGEPHGSLSHEAQWTMVNNINNNNTNSNSSGFSTSQAQHATTSTLGFTQGTQQSPQGQYPLQQQQQQQQVTQQFQQACASQFANASMTATTTTSTTQIGQSLTEMLARLEQSHREAKAQHNGGSPLSPSAFLLDPHARLEYLEEIEDLLHNRHLQLYVGPRKSKTPRIEMDLIDTPGLLDAAAFTDPFVDLDHLAGILAQVKRAGHVTALVYVINIDRPYDSASLEALVTYLTNLRELCSNLIVVHSSYNVHKVLESAKAAAVSSGSATGVSEPSSFCLFDLGNRVSEFNKQLAQLGFPDIRPVHVAMDNVVPPTARAGIKALCFEGLHVFLDVVEEFAKQKATPIERVSMVKLRLVRDVDMHVSVFLTNIIDTIRAQLYTLGQSGNETHLLIAAEKLATTRAELRRIESELARLDTDDHVEIDQRTVKRLPMTVVREGTRRALVVLVYESKAGNIRSARLVQPRWPRAHVRHEHVDAKRYVAVLAPPPSSPWAVGPYVHVQLFTHRRDVFAVEIGKLRISKGELAGKLTEQEAELAKWTRKLGQEKRQVAELETRLTTVKRALGVVDGDRLPLELFVEVVDQYREIAKLQYAGKKVDQVLVKALGESVERFFYRRC